MPEDLNCDWYRLYGMECWTPGDYSSSSKGDLTAYLVWQPAFAGDVPTGDHIYVKQTATAWGAVFSGCGISDGYNTPPNNPGTLTVDDGLGDAAQGDQPGGYPWGLSSSGSHLKSISISPGQTTAQVAVHGVSVVETAPHADATHDRGFCGDISIWYRVALDKRAATVTPLGHGVTYHKGTKKNADGTDFIDPATGNTVPAPEANKPNNDSLQVDIGLPIFTFLGPEAHPHLYSISYKGSVQGGSSYPQASENTGDTYNFTADLDNSTDSGTMPLSLPIDFMSNDPLPTTWDIPALKVGYREPDISYGNMSSDPTSSEYAHPQLDLNDANGADGVKFTYKFQKDGAQADYNLNVILHLPYDHWQKDRSIYPTGEHTGNGEYQTVTCSPASQDSQHPVEATYDPMDTDIEFAAELGSGALAGLGALLGEHPAVAAFLVVTGYALDKAAPKPESEPDNFGNWEDAVNQTRAAEQPGGDPQKVLISPIDFAAYDAMTDDREAQLLFTMHLDIGCKNPGQVRLLAGRPLGWVGLYWPVSCHRISSFILCECPQIQTRRKAVWPSYSTISRGILCISVC